MSDERPARTYAAEIRDGVERAIGRFQLEQRESCLRKAIEIGGTDDDIIRRADAFYRFVIEGALPS